MEAAFKIPSDLPLLRQFTALVDWCQNRSKAYHIWYLVWQELFYRAQEGDAKGRIPAAQLPAMLRVLLEIEPDEAKRDELFHKGIVEHSGLLQADGDDYVCPRFMLLNAHVGKGSKESVGGNRKAFISRQKKQNPFGQSLLIEKEKFVDGDGQPLPAEETKRVTWLIISCDNALYKPSRQPVEFSEGLIQSAVAILKKYTDEEIDVMVNVISKFRDHPALNGMNAEKLLPELENTVRGLN